jgi:hypothetical protein
MYLLTSSQPWEGVWGETYLQEKEELSFKQAMMEVIGSIPCQTNTRGLGKN